MEITANEQSLAESTSNSRITSQARKIILDLSRTCSAMEFAPPRRPVVVSGLFNITTMGIFIS